MTRRLPFEELFSQAGRFVPSGAATLGTGVKKNLRALIGAALTRMDLVSREEFDVQSASRIRGQSKNFQLYCGLGFLRRGPGFCFAMRKARVASICFWKYSAPNTRFVWVASRTALSNSGSRCTRNRSR
ncbi:MAG: accessory factor UbiK family protein [Chromatiales bacterium]